MLPAADDFRRCLPPPRFADTLMPARAMLMSGLRYALR